MTAITVEQVKAQYRRNAEGLSAVADRASAAFASGKRYRGYTEYEWNRLVRDAWNRAWLTAADLAPEVQELNRLVSTAAVR